MKIKELKLALTKIGASFIEQGANHEKWSSVNGHVFTVPRHREISNSLAAKILKQASC